MVTIFIEKIYPHLKLFTLNRLSHLSLLNGKIMALQQMTDNKNPFSFIKSTLSSFYKEQILSAVLWKIVPCEAKFVKSQQTIRICKALVMTENLVK